jgi:hypothetical protein
VQTLHARYSHSQAPSHARADQRPSSPNHDRVSAQTRPYVQAANPCANFACKVQGVFPFPGAFTCTSRPKGPPVQTLHARYSHSQAPSHARADQRGPVTCKHMRIPLRGPSPTPDQSSAKRWPRCFLCTLLKWPSQVTSCVSPSQPVYRIALHSTFLLQLITATEQVYVSTKHAHSGCASRPYKQTHIYNTPLPGPSPTPRPKFCKALAKVLPMHPVEMAKSSNFMCQPISACLPHRTALNIPTAADNSY